LDLFDEIGVAGVREMVEGMCGGDARDRPLFKWCLEEVERDKVEESCWRVEGVKLEELKREGRGGGVHGVHDAHDAHGVHGTHDAHEAHDAHDAHA